MLKLFPMHLTLAEMAQVRIIVYITQGNLPFFLTCLVYLLLLIFVFLTFILTPFDPNAPVQTSSFGLKQLFRAS